MYYNSLSSSLDQTCPKLMTLLGSFYVLMTGNFLANIADG